LWLSLGFPDPRSNKLRGASIAAPQIVIVSERRSRESNDPNRRSPLHGPLPASLSQTPTPHTTFVANKGQTPIRKDCRKPVDPSFSRFFDLESRCISLVFATCHSLATDFHIVRPNIRRITPNHSPTNSECKANFVTIVTKCVPKIISANGLLAPIAPIP
jgi:hypothetical protein